ncbi:MAG: alpha-amylase, partial [Anaerolineae bacterium]|nr:alpha-amylase [Anaerolineae bacterium]
TGTKPDPDIRTPMQWETATNGGFTTGTPWRAVNADVMSGINVAAQRMDLSSLLNHYKKLIDLRNTYPALRTGDMTLIETTGSANIIAFLRHTDTETILVILNLRPRDLNDYGITLEASPISPSAQMTVLYGDSNLPAPTINENGGFENYIPLPVLPARSTIILRFASE